MQKCCTIPFSLDSGAKKSVPCPRSDIIKVLAESVVFLRFGDLVASTKSKLAKAHIKNTLQHVKCPTTSILKALVFSWPAEVRCCRHGLMLRWTALGPGICLSFPVFWCWSMAVLLENWFLIWGLWHACNPLGYSDYYWDCMRSRGPFSRLVKRTADQNAALLRLRSLKRQKL